MKWIFLLPILIFGCNASADDDNKWQQSYQLGKTFFKEGNYSEALVIFESLFQQGANSNDFIFNLASTYYRTNNFDQARKHFTTLTQVNDIAATAYLNLGLIAVKLEQQQQATKLFNLAIQFDNKGNITPLAEKMLTRIANDTKMPTPGISLFFINGGFEDKIIAPENEETSKDSSNRFIDASLFISRNVLGNYIDALAINVNGFTTYNISNSDYNFSLLSTEIDKTFRQEDWNINIAFSPTYMHLGTQAFQSTFQLSAKSVLYFFDIQRASLRIQSAYVNGFGEDYSAYDGQQHQLRAQTTLYFGAIRWKSYYEYEFNNRENLRLSENYYDYSPYRNKIKSTFYYSFNQRFSTQLTLSYRASRYRNDHILNGEAIRRNDDQYKAAFQMAIELIKDLEVSLEYDFTRNESSINTYQYTRNQYIAGITYQY